MALRAAGFKRNILITALAVCHPVQGLKRAWQSGQVIVMVTP